LLHRYDRACILVGLTRPEEAFEAIFAPARHDMAMQVRDALADTIVDSDEGAVGFQPTLDRAGQELGVGHQGCKQSGRQVKQRAIVSFGDQEATPPPPRCQIPS
jgi:hypothetical protein